MCRDAVKWVFTLEEDFTWTHGPTVTEAAAFRDKTGVVRLILMPPSTIVVTRDYAWDGCSPKFCVLDLQLGTPDGVIDSRTRKRKTYYASLVHDALYQFLSDGLPFTRAQADACLVELMAETQFTWRYAYWIAVRTFGWLFAATHRYIRQNHGQKIALVSASTP